MLKKFSAIIASAALLVTGLGASPASATTPPDVTLANMAAATWMDFYNKTGDQFTIPDGRRSVFANQIFSIDSTWVDAHKGQTLSFSFVAKDKDGAVIPDWKLTGADDVNTLNWAEATINLNDSTFYYWNSSAWGMYVQTPSTGLSNVIGSSFQVPSDGGNIRQISFQLSQSLFKGNFFDTTSSLPAGVYSMTTKLFADGVEVLPSDAGVHWTPNTSLGGDYESLSITALPGRNGNIAEGYNAVVCVDPAKVNVGDTVKSELFIDGVSVNNDILNGNRMKGMLNPTTMDNSKMFDPSARQGITQADTATVTQFDKDWGLAFQFFWSDRSVTWADGTTHTAAVKLYNTATNADVSGNCAPGKTNTPTLSVNGAGNTEVTVTPALKSNVSYCIAYDKAADRKIVAYALASVIAQGDPTRRCTFDKSIFISGHNYEFDTVSGYFMAYGYSQGVTTDGSTPKLNGAGGAKVGGGTGSTVQTITFNAPAASKSWLGSTNLDLGVTVSSNLTVSYSSTTPSICTVNSSTGHVTPVAAGDCTITASSAGDPTYAPVTKTVTFAIAASQPGGSTAQTITLTVPSNPSVDLEGIDLGGSSTSGLALTFASSTPSVCTVDAATGHVTAVAAGDCTITASQDGNNTYAAQSKSVTFTIAAAATTPITDNGNPAAPTVTPKTGTWVSNGDTGLSWNRPKGALAFRILAVYTGPIKATATFKSGSKTYTCSVSFGILKKQASAKSQRILSPNFCSGTKEKTQLAILKKIAANTVVKMVITRELHVPTTYAKVRMKYRTIYVKLG